MPDKAPDFRIVIGYRDLVPAEKTHIGSLELQESLDETAKFEFSITDSEAIQLDPTLYRLGTPVMLYLGYVDDLSLVFHGEIAKVAPDFPQEASVPRLQITCHDLSYKLKRAPGAHIFKSSEYPNLYKIATYLINKYGLDAIINPDTPLKDYKLGDGQSINQEDETDWEILNDIAKGLNHRLFVRETTVYIVSDNYLMSEQVAFKNNMIYRPTSKQLRQAQNNIPLLSFRPEVGSDGQRERVEVLSWHVRRAKPDKFSKAELSETTTEKGGDIYTEIRVKTEVVETLRIFGVAISPDNEGQARALAEAEIQRRADNLVHGYDAVIPGNPLIRPGQEHWLQLNALGKFGQQYSGNYFLTSVRHELTTDEGFLTYFDCRRSGLTKT